MQPWQSKSVLKVTTLAGSLLDLRVCMGAWRYQHRIRGLKASRCPLISRQCANARASSTQKSKEFNPSERLPSVFSLSYVLSDRLLTIFHLTACCPRWSRHHLLKWTESVDRSLFLLDFIKKTNVLYVLLNI